MSFTSLPGAAFAIALVSAALTLGAAVVAGADQADHDVTGSIGAGIASGNDDHYVDMFAKGPGRGWFVLHRAALTLDAGVRHGTEP